MTYWHIQMNQPWGRDGGKIDSSEMLNNTNAVIGTGEWDDIQCRYFTGEDDRAIEIGDIVLVREGKEPMAICEITSDCFHDEELTKKFHHENYRNVDILGWVNGPDKFPQVLGTLQRLTNPETESWKVVNKLYKQILINHSMDMYINILEHKKQIILQGPPGTGKTYTAKDIAEKMIFGSVSSDKNDQKNNLNQSEYFKLIQFHPSYTYEDFVRGIVAEPEGEKVIFQAKDKTLAKFAKEAFKNYLESRKNPEEISKDLEFNELLYGYIDLVRNELEKKGKYYLNTTAYITKIDEEAELFRYTGDFWGSISNLRFSELQFLYEQNITEHKQIRELEVHSAISKGRSTYYFEILQKFKAFVDTTKIRVEKHKVQNIDEKKFILIIDEINRANLPSVLGELIYALEYRGESVESMYDIDGDRKIIIPPNLYIIGTMNTADRSVGHIDYAIRRRFAFVDVLPSDKVIDDVIKDESLRNQAKNLFNEVSKLFREKNGDDERSNVYLASDFKTKEVQLGHSYFLANSKAELVMKLEYEIKPILKEYVKDGILSEKAESIINSLKV